MNKNTILSFNDNCLRYFSSVVIFTFLFFLQPVLATNSIPDFEKKIDPNDPNPTVYEQVLVNVIIEGLGSFDLDVVYSDKNNLYINVVDLFTILKIPCTEGEKGISLDGTIGEKNLPYSINFVRGLIKVGDKAMRTNNKIIKEFGVIYLDATAFKTAFGINLDFNFRTLTVKLSADFELPIIKQLRQDKIRKNISTIKNEIVFDTVIKRTPNLFKVGTFDWALGSYNNLKESVTNIVGLGLGAEV